MRKDPNGLFYLRRGLQDDLSLSDRRPTPNSSMDFVLVILRVAEVIAVGRAFARALGCSEEDTMLEFAFRWRGLHGRTLTSWANPGRLLSEQRQSVQDTAVCRVTVPLITAPETTVEHTQVVVDQLFALFDGFQISTNVTKDLVTRLLERRLD